MKQARFVHMETGRQVQDGLPMLNGHYPACGKAAAVAVAFDLIENRLGGIAGAHEIGMQRMHRPVFGHGHGGGADRLGNHLPAKTAPAPLGRGDAAKEILLDFFNRQNIDESGHQLRVGGLGGGGHRGLALFCCSVFGGLIRPVPSCIGAHRGHAPTCAHPWPSKTVPVLYASRARWRERKSPASAPVCVRPSASASAPAAAHG